MPHRRRPVNGDSMSSSSASFPTSAEVLRERVYNNERLTIALQGEVHEIRSTMATQEDVRSLQAGMAGIAGKLDQIGRPQWQALSVMLGALVVIGGLVYWPIRESQSEAKEFIREMRLAVVPRVEHEKEWRRAELALTETRTRIEKNQEALVPRDVFMSTTTGLQRQVDEIRRDVGGVVTTRDALQSLEKKQERLELELRDALRRNGSH